MLRHRHRAHHGAHLVTRSPHRPDPVPHHESPDFVVPGIPDVVKRAPMPTSESDSTCTSDNPNKCEKPTSTASTTTLPVVLGAVVPIVCAIIVLIYLHRRNVKKLRSEDANDKHKSLDFGLDMEPTSGNKSMRQMEKPAHMHGKGISLDIGPSPYLLPPGLHGSHDSLHSLSRSMVGDGDKYRPAASFFGDNASIRSHPRGLHDDAASFSGSTRKAGLGDDMNQGLLRNAQRMSRSSPPLYNNSPPNESTRRDPNGRSTPADTGFQLDLPRSPSPVLIPGAPAIIEPSTNTHAGKEESTSAASMGHAHTTSPSVDHSGPADKSFDAHTPAEHRLDFTLSDSLPTQLGAEPTSQPTSAPPRISLPLSEGSDYGDNRKSMFVIPEVNVHETDKSHESGPAHPDVPPTLPEEPAANTNLTVDPRRNTRRMTLGLRPLPPEDPSDNPEQRANRIRSFYKEYFDESKAGRESYYEDYGPEFYPDESYAYDPVTGEYFDAVPAPFAEPINRRAMTPPPRAPPRFQGPSMHMPTGSMGGISDRFHPPGPRAFSSASGRLPGPRAPRRPVPPPAPLQILPTPHMLKDDAIMSAIDFAPAGTFKDQREGRPETPMGGMRPFSPGLRAHTPLASAFDDLAPIPSPHALRKSGTYDNLDFAPPPRFKTGDTMSDAGSIRSNRTGISNTHLNNIRTGAYRVSRLPAETVGTKQDLMSSLHPKWEMRQ
ncbi:conserved hypothetical protein [Aspergillus terreus NIH2624]|uniref:Uncharacterized protein n=1 Tax=Aspergillus terreus (strain NIH 2624 / FGSC A1156) TaxID=341663 RepID=Q0CHL5_ASPTN|nr:uncharacterized protein ATEG_06819 [Aspergillus terreus NIH2624]EAU33363.1 conserved hypothetical protein [Aspergillus terreus NIH2624]